MEPMKLRLHMWALNMSEPAYGIEGKRVDAPKGTRYTHVLTRDPRDGKLRPMVYRTKEAFKSALKARQECDEAFDYMQDIL